MTIKHDVHVVPHATRPHWRVTHAGLALSTHLTQRRAVVAGKRVARRNRLGIVTHARDGRFRSRESYGDRCPARHREH